MAPLLVPLPARLLASKLLAAGASVYSCALALVSFLAWSLLALGYFLGFQAMASRFAIGCLISEDGRAVSQEFFVSKDFRHPSTVPLLSRSRVVIVCATGSTCPGSLRPASPRA